MSEQQPDSSPSTLPDPFLRLRAADIPCPSPVFVGADWSVARAARAMAEARATAALVRQGEGDGVESLGILTERDVLVRVAAAGLDPNTTDVGGVMTRGLVTAGPSDLLFEVFSRMVHKGIRRMVLLDESGRPAGLLGEGDMLAARGESPLALAAEIAEAPDGTALAASFHRLARLGARSVAEGIGSEAVGRLITEMHDRIMSAAWGLAHAAVAQELGPPPGPCLAFVLGSQARREQYLATDLDLALAWGAGAESGAAGDLWRETLGRRLTELLLCIGFPPCPRRIMPDNAEWRRSVPGWIDLADACAERPDAEGVVLASLLADLRPLPAPAVMDADELAELGAELRRGVLARFTGSAILHKCMAREAVRFSPPLGIFGALSLKRDERGRQGLDVKRGGVFPITQGTKALAVAQGLDATGTADRLRALVREGILTAAMAGELRAALDLLQTSRMRTQALALRRGEVPDNVIVPEELPAAEREALRQALKLVESFQGHLSKKFALHLMA